MSFKESASGLAIICGTYMCLHQKLQAPPGSVRIRKASYWKSVLGHARSVLGHSYISILW